MSDASALAPLLAQRGRFLAFVERRVGSRELAEEILQDAFVRGLEAAATLRDDESVIAWFYRVLRNAIIDRARRRAAEGRGADAYAQSTEALAADEPSPDDRAAICTCVTGVVGALKAEYGAALRRVDLEGSSVGAWAAEAGITPGNAAVRLHRARQALAREVHKTCGACAEHGCTDCSCRKP
jgi:RNA polymerase sigma factor (sigma-70 family)